VPAENREEPGPDSDRPPWPCATAGVRILSTIGIPALPLASILAISRQGTSAQLYTGLHDQAPLKSDAGGRAKKTPPHHPLPILSLEDEGTGSAFPEYFLRRIHYDASPRLYRNGPDFRFRVNCAATVATRDRKR